MDSSLLLVETKTLPNKLPPKLNQNKNRITEKLENQAFSWLQSCKNFKQMTQIHAHIIRNSIHQNNFVITKLVSYCFSSHNPCYATKALLYYIDMLSYGSKPNNFTYPFLLKACSKLFAFEVGKVLHGHILKLGFDSDVYVQTSLLDLYGNCGDIVASRNVFDRMSERDVVAWNAMLVGYTRSGLVEIAEKLFSEMPARNVSSWTTMISGYVQVENSMKALEVFQEMQMNGVRPDKLTVITVLSAISNLGSLEMGKWVHDYVKSKEIEIDGFVGTSLIDMYSKCGSINEARDVFDKINQRTISCYNAMISGYAVHGLGEEAISVFREAERLRIGIDDVTMIGVLSACSHSGLVDLGYMYFDSMKKKYGIEPKVEHYGCIVDLLGRAGKFDEAMEIIESTEADIVLLGTLAFSCRIHGNLELGEELARRIYKLDPTNSGLMVLKSNLFAVEGKWEEAAGVRRSMKDKGIRKKPDKQKNC
ncbi:hypothetical protein C5167_004972 [Papaver somniferum]|uniref:Pentacotripeptide-repeat region of PRORP domain-containing protein n=1 Tax=Papaver somniferum TaxID=3469 RepID=A0A4Y7JCP2_PAPSO|nr:hypothetical protein C5167_004972 [Papaver somniferum]